MDVPVKTNGTRVKLYRGAGSPNKPSCASDKDDAGGLLSVHCHSIDMQSEALPSSRYGTRSSKMMLLLFLLASAAVGRVAAFSDEELFVIEKRLQWQTQEAQIKRDLPKCRKNEQLCPISRGSNDLHVST